MIYLDYSATTPVDKEVLDTFNKASNKISFFIVNFIFIIPSFLIYFYYHCGKCGKLKKCYIFHRIYQQ